MKHLIALPVLTALALPAAADYVLDFGSDRNVAPQLCTSNLSGLGALVACGGAGDAISQTYGDVADIVNVTYSDQSSARAGQSLRWWAENYNNLYGVAYADGTNEVSKARIELKPLALNTMVTLISFDLGSYFKTSRATNINIYAIGGVTPLFTRSNIGVGNATTQSPTTFTPNISSPFGLWIEWQNSAYNVGIDNIRFSVTAAVDEPDSAALLSCGLIVLGWWGLRRERGGTSKSDALVGVLHRPGA